MSLYNKQEFVSAVTLFAEVKEELKSYFASGAIDDVMFPKWLEHCMKRLRKSAFKISETILCVKDYEACLPDDFDSVREAWACAVTYSDPYQSASAYYYQEDCRITIPEDSCAPCFEVDTECDTTYLVTHKVTNTNLFSFKRSYLLKPGNMSTRGYCNHDSPNLHAQSWNTFDIHNGKMITNACEGTIHLLYYATLSDEEPMVIDNFWVQDFVRKFLIYKCFCQLSNVITDETFNQIQSKKQESNQIQEEAFIIAETELKKNTVTQKMAKIKDSYNSFRKYRLP